MPNTRSTLTIFTASIARMRYNYVDNTSLHTPHIHTYITHWVPISNSQLCSYEVIMNSDDKTWGISFQNSQHSRNVLGVWKLILALRDTMDNRSKFIVSLASCSLSSYELRKWEFPYRLPPCAPASMHTHAPFNMKSGIAIALNFEHGFNYVTSEQWQGWSEW